MKLAFFTFSLLLTVNCFGFQLPDNLCAASISTSEGIIELMPTKMINPNGYPEDNEECKDYIMGRLNRLCLKQIFKSNSIIDVVVHRQIPHIYSQSFMTAQCNVSFFGSWSFNPDISYAGYYTQRPYKKENFPKTILFSEIKQ